MNPQTKEREREREREREKKRDRERERFITYPPLSRYLQQPENQDPGFAFTYRGPVPMKGRKEPMQVWFLSRRKAT